MIFRVVVEKDESGYYVGEVPALPGCLSQGKSVYTSEFCSFPFLHSSILANIYSLNIHSIRDTEYPILINFQNIDIHCFQVY
jgi:hypothetical protein